MLDRFFDNYVMTPMQKIVVDHLRPEDERDPRGVAEARALLDTAYRWLDGRPRRPHLGGGPDASASPTAPPRRRCSTPTGCIRSPTTSPRSAATAPACWRGRRSPAPSTRPGPTARSSRPARRTATDAALAAPRPVPGRVPDRRALRDHRAPEPPGLPRGLAGPRPRPPGVTTRLHALRGTVERYVVLAGHGVVEVNGETAPVAADRRDGGCLDLRGPAMPDIRADGHGAISFRALQASVDLAYGHSDVAFDWEGDDDMHEVRGSGPAELLEDGSIEIEFEYHRGGVVLRPSATLLRQPVNLPLPRTPCCCMHCA